MKLEPSVTVLDDDLCNETVAVVTLVETDEVGRACLTLAFCCCCGREMRGLKLPNGALQDKVSRKAFD